MVFTCAIAQTTRLFGVTCNSLGGIGGSGSFAGSSAGGDGGQGGERGTYEFPAGGEAFPGYDGEQGEGIYGGFAGDGGEEIFTTVISIECDRTPANPP